MKLIQIRNVPDEVHRRLKIRAAQRSRTLSDLALEALTEYSERPTMDEVLDRIQSREAVELPDGAAAALDEARGER
jgi:plasmid stability protein